MPYSTFQEYLCLYIHHIDWSRLIVISVFSLALLLFLLVRKKYTVYGSIALVLTFFFCLFLVDFMVLIRFSQTQINGTGINLQDEFNRLFHGTKDERAQMLFNIIAFVPLGFFLSEFFSATAHLSVKRVIGFVAIASLSLSLCIECLQLLFCLGMFELTDMLMNTSGALIGASLAFVGRTLFRPNKGRESTL